jgi:hypothetical protein
MSSYHETVNVLPSELMTGSTDQGNVSYEIPSLHSIVGIPCPPQVKGPHTVGFAKCAGSEEAFECAVRAGKAMALLGWDILVDEELPECEGGL